MQANQQQILRDLTDLALLIFRANRSMNQSADLLADCPVPPTQLHALVAIKKMGSLNMTELAQHLLMTRQQLTRVVDALVEKEFVRRKNDPSSRRRVLIEVTEKGDQFMIDTFLSKPSLLSRLLDTMDEEDSEKLHMAITMIKDILSKI